MKKTYLYLIGVSISLLTITACTTGSATRTSGTIYQPTNSSSVQILFEKPNRPYEVIGQVGSQASIMASDDAVYRAMQKEAAEIGAHAILIQGSGIEHEHSWGGDNYQRSKALALRWKDGGTTGAYSVTPTDVNPTTPKQTQIIPKNAGQ